MDPAWMACDSAQRPCDSGPDLGVFHEDDHAVAETSEYIVDPIRFAGPEADPRWLEVRLCLEAAEYDHLVGPLNRHTHEGSELYVPAYNNLDLTPGCSLGYVRLGADYNYVLDVQAEGLQRPSDSSGQPIEVHVRLAWVDPTDITGLDEDSPCSLGLLPQARCDAEPSCNCVLTSG
ncbi:MAG: hypothetical protein H6741_28745 [Alphaproteobacteria bacterium]|nr:hypothetical protein [Alphaproteobacteria bacterium]